MSRIKLNKMVAYHNKIKCDVMRKSSRDDATVEQVWSSQLVPGDVIILPQGDFKVPCDAVLVSGLNHVIRLVYLNFIIP